MARVPLSRMPLSSPLPLCFIACFTGSLKSVQEAARGCVFASRKRRAPSGTPLYLAFNGPRVALVRPSFP